MVYDVRHVVTSGTRTVLIVGLDSYSSGTAVRCVGRRQNVNHVRTENKLVGTIAVSEKNSGHADLLIILCNLVLQFVTTALASFQTGIGIPISTVTILIGNSARTVPECAAG